MAGVKCGKPPLDTGLTIYHAPRRNLRRTCAETYRATRRCPGRIACRARAYCRDICAPRNYPAPCCLQRDRPCIQRVASIDTPLPRAPYSSAQTASRRSIQTASRGSACAALASSRRNRVRTGSRASHRHIPCRGGSASFSICRSFRGERDSCGTFRRKIHYCARF
jgi:hypothetical protein